MYLKLQSRVFEVWRYQSAEGQAPLTDWLHGLRDKQAQGRHGQKLVILLCGGDKKSQTADIRRAKALWIDWKRRQAWAER